MIHQRIIHASLTIFLSLLLLSVPARATEPESTSPAAPEQAQTEPAASQDAVPAVPAAPVKVKKPKIKWKTVGGYYYCYINRKKAKGLQEISGKKYLFDKKGRQLTGWRQVGKKIYYFRIKNGAKGYMLKGKKVNGIRLKKNGQANVTSSNRQKANLLLRYQKLASSMTRPTESLSTKLVRVFKYARDMKYMNYGNPTSARDWDQKYAAIFLETRYGDCLAQGCGFAYLANAIGCKNVTVRLYYHCHCEINKRIYDPGFAREVPDSQYTRYFNRAYSDLPDWGTAPWIENRAI